MGDNPPKEFRAFLEQLKGEVDSSGEFTLDPLRARALLSNFQLPSPSHYALHMVSFLVGIGAPKVEVEVGADKAIFSGQALLDERWVKAPMSCLFGGTKNRFLEELAVAVNSVLGHATGVILRSGLCESCWSEGSSENHTLAEPAEGCQIEISFERRDAFEEEQLIREHFALCPVPVFVNGRPVPGDDLAKPGSLEVIWENPEHPFPLGPRMGTRHRFGHSAQVTIHFRLGVERGGFHWISYGRSYQLPYSLDWRGLRPNLRVTLVTDKLDRDLSQTQVVENAVYRNLMAYTERLWFKFLERMTDEPNPQSEVEWELLDFLVERIHANNEKPRAVKIQRALYALASESGDDWLFGKAAHRLSVMAPGDVVEQKRAAKSAFASLSEGRHDLSAAELISFETARAYYWFAENPAAGANKLLNWAHGEHRPPWYRLQAFRWALSTVEVRGADRGWLAYAKLLFEHERSEEAREALEKLGKAFRYRFVDDKFQQEFRELQALVCTELGLYAEAVEQLTTILQAQVERFGRDSQRLGLTLLRLATLSDHLDDPGNAETFRTWANNLEQP